ncbi:hypothetical protein PAMP_023947 [Pampus punctatissimus]
MKIMLMAVKKKMMGHRRRKKSDMWKKHMEWEAVHRTAALKDKHTVEAAQKHSSEIRDAEMTKENQAQGLVPLPSVFLHHMQK